MDLSMGTLEFFDDLSQRAAPSARNDIIKIGHVFAGLKYMALTLNTFARVRRDVVRAEISRVNETSVGWVMRKTGTITAVKPP